FHARAVVPGAVEDDEFPAGRQMRHEALEIPFGFLAVVGNARRIDARFARRHVGDEALDGAVLAGGVAAFENDERARAGGDEIALKLHQLDLQVAKRMLVMGVLAFVVVFFFVAVILLRHHFSVARSPEGQLNPPFGGRSKNPGGADFSGAGSMPAPIPSPKRLAFRPSPKGRVGAPCVSTLPQGEGWSA